MGTGWRRALCTSVQRESSSSSSSSGDDEHDRHRHRDAKNKNKKRRPPQHDAPSPRGSFFSAVKSAATSSGSNPSTPTLRCRTRPPPLQQPADAVPVTPPSAPAPAAAGRMRKHRVPLFQALSAPASPRSPSRFAAMLKASLLPSKSRCGVCSRGVKVKSGGGSSAVFTAECSHAFHFPCIAAHARSFSSTSSGNGVLSCPVCASPWRQAPFLASLRLHGGTGDGRKTPPPAAASNSGVPKLYDDDEPLPAPSSKAAGGGFNPIPEADEDDDDDVEDQQQGGPGAGSAEFTGFFPRPSRTTTTTTTTSSGLVVTVSPEAAALVSSGRRHGKYVVALKVKAPGLPLSSSSSSGARRRAAIDLVTVLDVTPGMSGEKLQTLKRGMRLVVASLGPADRLSIVAFSGAAKRLLPLRRMTRSGQRSARQIVDRLVVCAAGAAAPAAQTSSCVGDALRKATKVLEDRRDRNPVATVMLLSDTHTHTQQQTTAGVPVEERSSLGRPRRRPAVAAPAATRFTHVEIPIESSSKEEDEEEEDESESSSSEEKAFARCLGGLVSVVMQEVQLELSFPAGEITAVYSCGPGQQQAAVAAVSNKNNTAVTVVRLGELYAEEERELLLELRVPLHQGSSSSQASASVSVSVRSSYRDPATQESVRGGGHTSPPLLLPPLHGGQRRRRLHDLFVATRAVAEARRLAELQDMATAIHLLASARALLTQTSSSETKTQQQQELVASLDTELSDMRWRRANQTQYQQQEPLTPTSTSRRRRGGDGGDSGASTTSTTTTPATGEPLTPTSAWRAAEQLAKVAIMRKSMNRVSDLHGFENARF